MHLSSSTVSSIPRVNPKVNCGLWVIIMCQCRFIYCNRCTTLVGVVDNGKKAVHVRGRVGVYGKSPYLLLSFAIKLFLCYKAETNTPL